MYQFKRVRIFLVQIDTGDSGIINLAEKLAPVRASLVIYPSRGKQAYFVAVLEQADTEINIFAEAHGRKALQCLVCTFPNPHVETTRVELIHLLFPSTNATCRKERGHRVVDGFLYIRKAVRGLVRPSESVRSSFLQFLVYRFDVVGRQNAIRIEND